MEKKGITIPMMIVMTIIFSLLFFLPFRTFFRESQNRYRYSVLHEDFTHAVNLQLETERFSRLVLEYRYGEGNNKAEELIQTLELLQLHLVGLKERRDIQGEMADLSYYVRRLDEIFSWSETLLGEGRDVFITHFFQLTRLLDEALLMEQDLVRSTDIQAQMNIAGVVEELGRVYFRAMALAILAFAFLSALLILGLYQRKTNSLLRTGEEKFRLVFNEAYHFIGLLNEHGILTEVNETALALIGREGKDVLGRELGDTPWWNHTPETQEKIRRAVLSAQNGETVLFEAGHWDSRGKQIIADISVKPVMDSNGRVTRIIVEGRDVTERKIVEETLSRLREHLFHIIDSILSRIIVVDKSLNITLANSPALDEAGLSREEIDGTPLFSQFPYLAEFEDKMRSSIDHNVYNHIRKQRRKDDIYLHEDISIYPLTESGNEGAVIRIDDVTDRRLMEEMMIQSEKMMSVGGLAAGMAHEINNPLAGMIQAAEVIYNRLSSPQVSANRRAAEKAGIDLEKMARYMEERNILHMLESIRDSGARAAEIVENMLSFARKEGSVISTHQISDLMEKTIELVSTDYNLKKKYDFKSIEIIRDYEEDLPPVPCEGTKIQQVFLNILSNGAEAMFLNRIEKQKQNLPCPRPRFIIRLTFEAKTACLRIEIEDNGPGMEEEIRRRVFEPFFTTKSVGEGTGLGLSVSFFIIREIHRGNINVMSEPGKGARFIIQLPVKEKSSLSWQKRG